MSPNELPVVTSKLSVLQQYRSALTDRGLVAKQDIVNIQSRGIALPRVNRYGVRQYTIQPSKQGYGITLEDIDAAIGSIANRIPESLQWLVREYLSIRDNITRLAILPVFGLYTEKTWLKPFSGITADQVSAVEFSKSIGVKRSLDGVARTNRIQWYSAYAVLQKSDYDSFSWFLETRRSDELVGIATNLANWIEVSQYRIHELLKHMVGNDPTIPYKEPEEWTRYFIEGCKLAGVRNSSTGVWSQLQNKLWMDVSASDIVTGTIDRTPAYYLTKSVISPKTITDVLLGIKATEVPDLSGLVNQINPDRYSDGKKALMYFTCIEHLSDMLVGVHYSIKVLDRVLMRMRDLRKIQDGLLIDIQTYTRRMNKRE